MTTSTHARIYTAFMDGASVASLAQAFHVDAQTVEGGIRARARELGQIDDPAKLTAAGRARIAAAALRHSARLLGMSLQVARVSHVHTAVRARWIAWLAVMGLQWSWCTTARAFGVDHSSIIHADKRISEEDRKRAHRLTAALRAAHGREATTA